MSWLPVAVATLNVASLVVSFLLNVNAFGSNEADCPLGIIDQSIILLNLAVLVLTTPWNILIGENLKNAPLVTTSVPLALFLLYISLIVLSFNAYGLLNTPHCPNTGGRRGAYFSLVWINLFIFLHTTLLTFIAKYKQNKEG